MPVLKNGTGLSRRLFMSGAASTMATIAGPRARAAEPVITPLMQQLSTYMAGAGAARLPADAMDHTKGHILDTISAMISGAELPPGQFDLKFARTLAGNGPCTIAASNLLAGPADAALINALLAHSDETDDSHQRSQSHPGCAVVPAALAVCEKSDASGERFLNAVALGYDVGTRFGMMLGRQQYMAATHRSTHALVSNFGAAAAAGASAGLTLQQMRWLVSYAAQQASGLASWQRDTDHIEKAFDFGGMGARNGVYAALIVQAGGTGVDDVLGGADNFLQAFGPLMPPEILVDGLGTRFEVARTNYKKWTVGSPIQAPLDAVQMLMQKNKFTGDQAAKVAVRVATHEAAVVDNRVIPDICLQHMVAVMLVDGTVSFKAAHDNARMADPKVLAQRAKVELIRDEELEKLLPSRVAIVEITLTDGRKLTQRINAVRGTEENPMTRAEIQDKATDLIAPSLGTQTCKNLIDAIYGLEKMPTIRALRPLLQKT